MREVVGDDEKHLKKMLAFIVGSEKKVSTCMPLYHSPSRINQEQIKIYLEMTGI